MELFGRGRFVADHTEQVEQLAIVGRQGIDGRRFHFPPPGSSDSVCLRTQASNVA